MGVQRRIKTISKVTRDLLLQGESELADFKRKPDGVSADDLVAFANTESGGNILVGIEEQAGPDGTQQGIVRGCNVSDASILQILNKAVSCIPPVGVAVHVENLDAESILRVIVPSSESKPHCTPKGVYCRRDGSRNRPLHPSELLKIFLEKEASTFAVRFETAADRITADLERLEISIEDSIDSVGRKLGWAEYKLGITESTLDTMLSYVCRISDQATDMSARLRALFRQDNRKDPVRAQVRQQLLNEAVKQLCGDTALLDRIRKDGTTSFTAKGKAALELNKDDLQNILREAIGMATEKSDAEKYEVEVKLSSKATDDELDQFAALVASGGEVADGLRPRLRRASALGLLKYEDKIVGTAALKRPAPAYHKRVFEKAKSEHSATSYPLELGWIYLEVAHRGKKRIVPLIDALMNRDREVGVFATTRASNKKMQVILARYDFVRSGSTYPSEQSLDEELALFLRPPKETAMKSPEAATQGAR